MVFFVKNGWRWAEVSPPAPKPLSRYCPRLSCGGSLKHRRNYAPFEQLMMANPGEIGHFWWRLYELPRKNPGIICQPSVGLAVDHFLKERFGSFSPWKLTWEPKEIHGTCRGQFCLFKIGLFSLGKQPFVRVSLVISRGSGTRPVQQLRSTVL